MGQKSQADGPPKVLGRPRLLARGYALPWSGGQASGPSWAQDFSLARLGRPTKPRSGHEAKRALAQPRSGHARACNRKRAFMPETVFDQDRWDVYRVVIEFTAESFAVNTLPRDCRGSSQEAVAVVRRGRPLRDGRDEHLRGCARAEAKK